MSTQLIVLISIILLIGWLLGNIFNTFKIQKSNIYDSNFMFHVWCEKCKTLYDVTPRQYNEAKNTKYKKKKQAEDEISNVKPQIKKFFCPNCHRKEYAKILNLADYHEKYGGVLIKAHVKQFVYINIGTLAILLLMILLIWFLN